eukprot:tig00020616_g12253.t1
MAALASATAVSLGQLAHASSVQYKVPAAIKELEKKILTGVQEPSIGTGAAAATKELTDAQSIRGFSLGIQVGHFRQLPSEALQVVRSASLAKSTKVRRYCILFLPISIHPVVNRFTLDQRQLQGKKNVPTQFGKAMSEAAHDTTASMIEYLEGIDLGDGPIKVPGPDPENPDVEAVPTPPFKIPEQAARVFPLASLEPKTEMSRHPSCYTFAVQKEEIPELQNLPLRLDMEVVARLKERLVGKADQPNKPVRGLWRQLPHLDIIYWPGENIIAIAAWNGAQELLPPPVAAGEFLRVIRNAMQRNSVTEVLDEFEGFALRVHSALGPTYLAAISPAAAAAVRGTSSLTESGCRLLSPRSVLGFPIAVLPLANLAVLRDNTVELVAMTAAPGPIFSCSALAQLTPEDAFKYLESRYEELCLRFAAVGFSIYVQGVFLSRPNQLDALAPWRCALQVGVVTGLLHRLPGGVSVFFTPTVGPRAGERCLAIIRSLFPWNNTEMLGYVFYGQQLTDEERRADDATPMDLESMAISSPTKPASASPPLTPAAGSSAQKRKERKLAATPPSSSKRQAKPPHTWEPGARGTLEADTLGFVRLSFQAAMGSICFLCRRTDPTDVATCPASGPPAATPNSSLAEEEPARGPRAAPAAPIPPAEALDLCAQLSPASGPPVATPTSSLAEEEPARGPHAAPAAPVPPAEPLDPCARLSPASGPPAAAPTSSLAEEEPAWGPRPAPAAPVPPAEPLDPCARLSPASGPPAAAPTSSLAEEEPARGPHAAPAAPVPPAESLNPCARLSPASGPPAAAPTSSLAKEEPARGPRPAPAAPVPPAEALDPCARLSPASGPPAATPNSSLAEEEPARGPRAAPAAPIPPAEALDLCAQLSPAPELITATPTLSLIMNPELPRAALTSPPASHAEPSPRAN